MQHCTEALLSQYLVKKAIQDKFLLIFVSTTAFKEIYANLNI